MKQYPTVTVNPSGPINSTIAGQVLNYIQNNGILIGENGIRYGIGKYDSYGSNFYIGYSYIGSKYGSVLIWTIWGRLIFVTRNGEGNITIRDISYQS